MGNGPLPGTSLVAGGRTTTAATPPLSQVRIFEDILTGNAAVSLLHPFLWQPLSHTIHSLHSSAFSTIRTAPSAHRGSYGPLSAAEAEKYVNVGVDDLQR